MSIDEGPDQGAFFYIEGPDERGCVWIHGASSSDPWAHNLGPQHKVAEVLSQWLESVDEDEREDTQTVSQETDADEAEKQRAKRLRKTARPKDHRDEGGQG
jgi:hypothetical protein